MKQREKVSAILIDGSNIYAASRALGFFVDYKKLLHSFDGTVLKAYYFTALRSEDVESAVRPMVDYLSYNGWTCITKPTQEWRQENGEHKIKGNMDIEICQIANEIAPYVTDIFLFSGDGDFTFMVEALQRRYAVNVSVISTIKTQPAMCADSLRRQADQFIDLADMKDTIKRDEDTMRQRRSSFGERNKT